jgi:DNA replication and repair protein RecF
MNGQGKTSILESIYYLALTRSFRTNSDKSAIRTDCRNFDITGVFFSPANNEFKVRLYYSDIEGKNLFIKDKRITCFSEFVGMIPCVVLTLTDTKLVYGGPSERRKFLDILLSQTSSVYLNDLKQYKRILFQRNALLCHNRVQKFNAQLASWTKQLIDMGSAIICQRLSFISFLNANLRLYYKQLAGINADISATYVSSIGRLAEHYTVDQIKSHFEQALKRVSSQELQKQTTLIGPHRDETIFFYNLKPFKEYCSQGEVKTLIIVLKFLEWEYVRNQRHIKPILLLDDIFGELDLERMQRLLTFIKDVGQAHITTTLPDKFQLNTVNKVLIVREKKIYDA